MFVNFLILKMHAPLQDDLSKRMVKTTDTDSHRVKKTAMRALMLEDEDAEIDPVLGVGAAGKGEVEIDRLSEIIRQLRQLMSHSEDSTGRIRIGCAR